MIKSFKHKGLEKFFISGNTAGIQPAHAKKIRVRLAALNTAHHIEDMRIPGFELHSLEGNKSDVWSIAVSGNWRITFKFTEGDAHIVNYEDYH